ncbi:erythroblast NAD(P)(+)--arginine ADP-ribosyltransferase-like [Passer domesticus]|uniref:erythroblast NAD(P)(+)--arginine ADP-ribosyltransferase-like n=1 Tax=Passer domesticus TaxID=48849 RepID=UPI0030FE784A
MAPLAQTLALLVMIMSTAAIEVIPLDMAQDSFDDQYQGCGPAMTAVLLALHCCEFQQNKKFAEVWEKAMAKWQSQGSPTSPLSPEQPTAIMAFTTDGLSDMFNNAMRVAGRSRQEYWDNFHFKTLHFLLTDALATLRDAQKGQCLDVFMWACGVQLDTQHGDIVRFGQFMSLFLSKPPGKCSNLTLVELRTCHGVEIQFFTEHPGQPVVLIPPFETFKVIQVTPEQDKTQMSDSRGMWGNWFGTAAPSQSLSPWGRGEGTMLPGVWDKRRLCPLIPQERNPTGIWLWKVCLFIEIKFQDCFVDTWLFIVWLFLTC